jgi:hypothetical protein
MACQLRSGGDTPPWNGNPDNLTPDQRENLMKWLAEQLYPGDPAAFDKASAEAERAIGMKLIQQP